MRAVLKRLLLTQSLLTILLTVGMMGVRAMSTWDDRSPSPIQRTSRCVLPCWRGIQPGVTFIEQANGVFLGRGYNTQRSPQNLTSTYYEPVPPDRGCSVRLQQREALVTEIRFTNCADLRLGHVIAALGEPDTLSPNFIYYQFETGFVRLRLQPTDCTERLSPNTPITYISLSADESLPQVTASWLGFAPNWRYFRTSPHIPPLAC